jgi:hypothetical protein
MIIKNIVDNKKTLCYHKEAVLMKKCSLKTEQNEASTTKSEGDWLAPAGAGGLARRLRPNKVWSCVGYSEKLTQCVAATARPKRPEGLGAGAGQYEKRRHRDTLRCRCWSLGISQSTFYGEFDPGSGRTLAACLIHASRADRMRACSCSVSGGRVSNTWATYP